MTVNVKRRSTDDLEKDRRGSDGSCGAEAAAARSGAPLDARRRARLMAACSCICAAETAERVAYCERFDDPVRGGGGLEAGRMVAAGKRLLARGVVVCRLVFAPPTPAASPRRRLQADPDHRHHHPHIHTYTYTMRADGIATNMALYAKQYLGYDAARATSLLQAWKATVRPACCAAIGLAGLALLICSRACTIALALLLSWAFVRQRRRRRRLSPQTPAIHTSPQHLTSR